MQYIKRTLEQSAGCIISLLLFSFSLTKRSSDWSPLAGFGRTWTRVADMLNLRHSHACGKYADATNAGVNHLIVAAGFGAAVTTNEAEKYDLATNVWR